MFTIRRDHLQAFQQVAREEFEDRVIAHLTESFPEQCVVLGEDGVRAHVAHGLERARRHGFEAEESICLYIDLMVLFGRDFDTNPELPWVQAVLRDASPKDLKAKMRCLYEVALQELEKKDRAHHEVQG